VSRLQTTLAISLRKFDYSETSQILHLYTRDLGKVHCIAKGAKRKKSAFHGPFDVLVLYEVIRFEKQPGALDLLTAAEAVRDYREVRADFARFSAASYVCDLLDEFTLEGQPQPELFELLRETLERLARGAEVADAVFSFEARMLSILGHAPRVDACGSCGKRLGGPEAYFSARDGGAICTRCRPKDASRLLVKRPVLDAIGAFGAGRDANLDILPRFVDHLRRVLDYYLRFLLDHEPKSARFMREAVLAERPSGRL
jgi:DNA repair protein RecO (recombination protein O)